MPDFSIVILAAGGGTRMKSRLPKLLHKVAGAPMIAHLVRAAEKSKPTSLHVVTEPDADALRKAVAAIDPKIGFFAQVEKLGTGHAARMAEPVWREGDGFVAFVYGDHPLLLPETFNAIREKLEQGWDGAVLGFEPEDPSGYGRLVTEGEDLLAIVEHKDADEKTREIGLCNACILAFSRRAFREAVADLRNDNAQGEFYLTDMVRHIRARGGNITFTIAPEEVVAGVNTRAQLATAEAEFQNRMRTVMLDAGVTLQDPQSTYFAFDTLIASDVTIEPHVVFGPGVRVESDVVIRAFSHIEGAHIGSGSVVGPFARLRPGAELAENAHVGNFVEIKNATVGPGAKVNHLTYIGDASIGARTNVGAGTITCNYDGFNKHHTEIGADVFVGSNTALVAPVSVGDGALIAAGSTVTRDVPAEALTVARARQENRDGYAAHLRARAKAKKK
ncbi:MAG: bifunctional UDP-N-acetylglucosamine diphosphorylase/glucosamine-1-phosphate N-acetyltransferase GlmU [Hyphomicrobiaceae bacterium]|nr:bifunctional UDP-N-acetylglucosamine diphosphorylase/glucosamine-1-phosphate N-acetyltransferase GlmU [Hyphomicrobiaceae bacterium]